MKMSNWRGKGANTKLFILFKKKRISNKKKQRTKMWKITKKFSSLFDKKFYVHLYEYD